MGQTYQSPWPLIKGGWPRDTAMLHTPPSPLSIWPLFHSVWPSRHQNVPNHTGQEISRWAQSTGERVFVMWYIKRYLQLARFRVDRRLTGSEFFGLSLIREYFLVEPNPLTGQVWSRSETTVHNLFVCSLVRNRAVQIVLQIPRRTWCWQTTQESHLQCRKKEVQR